MEELDILKKDWKQRDGDQPKLTYNQIYNMLYKKSTSIVKWIFIISIAELLFWTLLSLLTPKSTYEVIETIGAMTFMIVFSIIHYIIFIAFIVTFIKNYYSIKVTDNTQQLMNSILKTRKTVKYFVIYNIAAFVIYLIGINVFYYLESDLLFELISNNSVKPEDKQGFMFAFFLIQILFSIIMIGIMLLFYRIVYGILLKRLHRNYQELKKIEL